MLIFFGVRSSEVLNEPIPENCTNCEAKGTLRASVHQEFAHFFFIPTFPLGKTGAIYCTNCGKAVAEERLAPQFRSLYLQVQEKARIPWWTFSGPVVYIGLFLVIILQVRAEASRSADYVSNPQAKDIYEVKTPDNFYTLFLVKAVSDDSVFVIASEYETNSQSGLRNLVSKKCAPDIFAFSKNEIKIMFNENEILKVHRGKW